MKVSASTGGAVLAVPPPEAAEQVPGRRDGPAPAPRPSEEKVRNEELLKKIQNLTEGGTYSVRFDHDEGSRRLVIRLVDAQSGELIRQIPPEELLGLSEKLTEIRGLLMNSST